MAMMLVLWVLAVLTIMAGGFALSTRRALDQTSYARISSQAVALADGGIHYAMFMLRYPDPKERWRSDGSIYTVRFPAGEVRVRVSDEAGRLDINAAQETTLRGFFVNLLGNDEIAVRLTDAILDWRDPDSLRRLHGAEIEDYRAAGRSQRPQNRPFVAPEELLGVLGMSPELYARVEPFITTWSGQDGINPNKATLEMLRIVFRGDEQQVAQQLQLRSQSLGEQQPTANAASPPNFQFEAAGDVAYRVLAETLVDGELPIGVEAVLQPSGGGRGNLPFAVATWKIITASAFPEVSSRDALGAR